MAIQLSSSYLRRSYQLLAKLTPAHMSGEQAFEQACDIIYDWAKQKFSRIFGRMPPRKSTFDDKRDGNELGIIYDASASQFFFRAAHPDAYIPGRMWITDAQVCQGGEEYLLAVRLSVTSLQSCTDEVPFSRPSFMRDIARQIGISDIIPISDIPHPLTSLEEVDGFLQLLEDSERRMPVILLTPCYRAEDAVRDGFMIDPAQFAKDLFGVAHVFRCSEEMVESLTERVGRQWSAFNGAVRTYYPDLTLAESDPFRHPLLTQQRIRLWNISEESAPDACMRSIEEHIQNYSLGKRIPWEEKGIGFYLTAQQNRLQEQRAASFQSKENLIASYEEQLEQLRCQSQENISLADSYAKDCEVLQAERDQYRQKVNQLKAQISTLRFQLRQATGDLTDQSVPENGTYADIPDWIQKYYPDRLVLHSRASRSLSNAIYADTGLVYRCLKLLASSYYDFRAGSITYDKFMADCKQVDPGLDERSAITDVAAGMEGDTYFVQYRGKRHKLERHLTKGNSKDRRYCLRIYFFWDDEEQTIVVGDLPHHLDTSAT